MGGKNSHAGIIWAVPRDSADIPSLLNMNEHLNVLEKEKADLQEFLTEGSAQLLANLREEGNEELLSLVEEQLQVVEKMATIWIKLYHSLVWLNAAVDPPGNKVVNDFEPPVEGAIDCDGFECILPNSHKVPAWSQDEFHEEGWLNHVESEQSLTKIIKRNFSQPNIENIDGNLEVANITEIMAQESGSGPFLEKLLDTTNDWLQDNDKTEETDPLFLFQDPELKDFDPLKCLEICRRSATKIKQQTEASEENDKKEIYVRNALDLIEALWRIDIENNSGAWADQVKELVTEVSAWWREIENGSEDFNFKVWLRNKHWILEPDPALSYDLLTIAINPRANEMKWVFNAMIAMLEVNKTTLKFILARCFPGSRSHPYEDIHDTIKNLTSDQMSDDEKSQWSYLLLATYRVLAWHFFHQITPSVTRAQEILGITP